MSLYGFSKLTPWKDKKHRYGVDLVEDTYAYEPEISEDKESSTEWFDRIEKEEYRKAVSQKWEPTFLEQETLREFREANILTEEERLAFPTDEEMSEYGIEVTQMYIYKVINEENMEIGQTNFKNYAGKDRRGLYEPVMKCEVPIKCDGLEMTIVYPSTGLTKEIFEKIKKDAIIFKGLLKSERERISKETGRTSRKKVPIKK